MQNSLQQAYLTYWQKCCMKNPKKFFYDCCGGRTVSYIQNHQNIPTLGHLVKSPESCTHIARPRLTWRGWRRGRGRWRGWSSRPAPAPAPQRPAPPAQAPGSEGIWGEGVLQISKSLNIGCKCVKNSKHMPQLGADMLGYNIRLRSNWMREYLHDLDIYIYSHWYLIFTSFAGSLIWMSTLRLTSSSLDTEIPLTPSISHKFRGCKRKVLDWHRWDNCNWNFNRA